MFYTEQKTREAHSFFRLKPSERELGRMIRSSELFVPPAIRDGDDHALADGIEILIRLVPYREESLLLLSQASDALSHGLIQKREQGQESAISVALLNKAYRLLAERTKAGTGICESSKSKLMELALLTADEKDAANNYLVVLRNTEPHTALYDEAKRARWQVLGRQNATLFLAPSPKPKKGRVRRFAEVLGLV